MLKCAVNISRQNVKYTKIFRSYHVFSPTLEYSIYPKPPVPTSTVLQTAKMLVDNDIPNLPDEWPNSKRYLTESKNSLVTFISSEVSSLTTNWFVEINRAMAVDLFLEKKV
jgi:hypothetical protein